MFVNNTSKLKTHFKTLVNVWSVVLTHLNVLFWSVRLMVDGKLPFYTVVKVNRVWSCSSCTSGRKAAPLLFPLWPVMDCRLLHQPVPVWNTCRRRNIRQTQVFHSCGVEHIEGYNWDGHYISSISICLYLYGFFIT